MAFKPNRLVEPLGRPAFFIVRFLPRRFAFLATFVFLFLAPCVALRWRAKWPAILKDLSHFEHLNIFFGITNLLLGTR
jgi:hypothetical protein